MVASLLNVKTTDKTDFMDGYALRKKKKKRLATALGKTLQIKISA